MSSKLQNKFWLAYYAAVKEKIVRGPLGPNDILYVVTETFPGIPAGEVIPEGVTNRGIYQLGDSLLRPDSETYNPLAADSYIQSLQRYLLNVDLGGSHSAADKKRWADAVKATDDADKRHRKLKKEALKDYAEDEDPNKGEFEEWAAVHARSYIRARSEAAAASAAQDQLYRELKGPLADIYGLYKTKIDDALTTTKKKGLNMPALNADTNLLEEYIDHQTKGEKIPEPEDIYYVPFYSMDNYKATLDNWVATYKTAKTDSISISWATGETTSFQDFGHTSTYVGGYAWWPFLFCSSFESDATTETFASQSDESEISIALTYKGMMQFPIAPGKSWDIPDVRRTFPHLLPGTPVELKTLARPTTILCASGVGLEVKFSGSAKKDFEEKYRKTSEKRGGIRIFDFAIGLGADETQETSHQKMEHSYEYETGSLTVNPKDLLGTCTVLAILMHKLEVS
ncbi:uncharacterized protein RAG0_08343 [Aspergillus terreus]|uniref:Uncharacterized protein RAG0_08343 n=1 Tax=Aspergillus terreus TaxID=33178 RepID=A0A5M3YUZ8_ASPTE|nr:hypothetical protein ATETN484_0004063100 [Aspergillus terreus]GFF13524.1 uncharacterized protein RAG0_08343 [Aspergillus terreus]